MSGKRSTRGNRYGAEVRSATVALVDKLRPQYPSLWATIERVSADTGIHTSTVRAWWRQREGADAVKPQPCAPDSEIHSLRVELEALREVNRELIAANRGL
ncbi:MULTISPECIES: hypothetical protein [Rhodococcus]|uniref:hypothetical protein n=1 Tax=Rhodococcus TaxID=1827 RepID=UPI001C5D1525|nr:MULTISPECIES: hypothetical protein [Rhodococcus]MBW4818164.1 hypothetical protein [Rhodococcus qingshengii]MCJ0906049.1 hypothetical protein [Rhodococcus sp. ARC_M6]